MKRGRDKRGVTAGWPLAPLLLLLALAGCTGGARNDPLLAQDLSDYTRKMVEWEGVEGRVLAAIAKVERNQFVDDDYVASTLQGVLAEVRLHTEQAARYKPRTRAMEAIHDDYLKTWRDITDSFDTIIRSMERHDYTNLARGVETMRRSRQELIEVAAAISDLLDTTGVKPPPSRHKKAKVKFRKGPRAPGTAPPAPASAQPAPGSPPRRSSSPH